MFTPTNLYHYLRYKYDWPTTNSIINNIYPDGGREISNIQAIDNIFYVPHNTPPPPIKFLGNCNLLDQEPINLADMFFLTNTFSTQQNNLLSSHQGLDSMVYQLYNSVSDKLHPLFIADSALHVPIVAHSELNSDDVSIMIDNSYIDVHYWAHGLYAQQWFHPYKYLEKKSNQSAIRLGLYARDASGTRSYRITLLNELAKINNQVFYKSQPLISNHYIKESQLSILSKWEHTPHDVTSNASASIDWKDHNKFEIQIVPDTLFNTTKTHLTEKILKPIVMYQPFIIFAGPYSLQYLRKYGFKTFNHLWDESYDVEIDPNKRFYKLIQLITHLARLPEVDFRSLMNKTKDIVEFNRSHFFNNNFENIMMNELHTNFSNAFNTQNQMFYDMPGGTLFYNYDILFTVAKNELPIVDKKRIQYIMDYLSIYYPDIKTQIENKYKKLLISL